MRVKLQAWTAAVLPVYHIPVFDSLNLVHFVHQKGRVSLKTTMTAALKDYALTLLIQIDT